MFTRVLIAIATFAALIMPEAANAQAKPYKEVGAWSLYQGNEGCYMVGKYERGDTFTIYVNKDMTALFWFQNKAWQSLRENSKHDIEIEFDNLGPWNLKATGKEDNDGPGLAWAGNIALDADGNSFFGEFMSAKGMTITFRGRDIASVKLTDSYKASLDIARCVTELTDTADPFSLAPSEDPFSQ